jgi:hypothetical protein
MQITISLDMIGVVAFVHVQRIVKEVTAVGRFLDLANQEPRMGFTIERGSEESGSQRNLQIPEGRPSHIKHYSSDF